MKDSRNWPSDGPQGDDDAASWKGHERSDLESISRARRLRNQLCKDDDQDGRDDDGKNLAGKKRVKDLRERLQKGR